METLIENMPKNQCAECGNWFDDEAKKNHKCVTGKIVYRYEIEYRSEDGDTDIRLREFKVTKETDHTYFIKDPGYYLKEKRIPKSAMNAYAHITKEKAKEHFIRRTNARIRWYHFWSEECEKALKIIENL